MKDKKKNRINEEISQWGKITSVRLVGENVNNGVYDLKYALNLAKELCLDLVEISNSGLSVCKVVDYQKFLYEQKQKAKLSSKNQKQQETKELRFTPNTDEHDFNTKMRHAEEFLKKGDKVKATVFFKGREITFKEKGEILMLRFAEALKEVSTPEHLPKLKGHKMILILKPKK